MGSRPPGWAEHLLRWMLRPHDREVISGDLLEEHDEIQQTLGRRRANRTYITQVLSVAIGEGRRRIAPAYVLIGGWIVLFFWSPAYSTITIAANRTHHPTRPPTLFGADDDPRRRSLRRSFSCG